MKATTNAPVVRTDRLTKYYGRHLGIEGLDLEIGQGEIFGFLGPNGAGKTTTIRLFLDLIRPTEGAASIFGLDTRSDSIEIRRRVGYVPGELALYEKQTAMEFFELVSNVRGDVDRADLESLIERFELDVTRPIAGLSKGNKQKVGLVQAFMHDPDLLILDEPTAGLDPLVQKEVHRYLQEKAALGRTVFLSSHALDEVEAVANRVGIIRTGHLVAVDDVRTLKARALHQIEVVFAHAVTDGNFATLPGVRHVDFDGTRAVYRFDGSPDPIVKAIARYEISSLSSHEADLEDIFLSYYEEAS